MGMTSNQPENFFMAIRVLDYDGVSTKKSYRHSFRLLPLDRCASRFAQTPLGDRAG